MWNFRQNGRKRGKSLLRSPCRLELAQYGKALTTVPTESGQIMNKSMVWSRLRVVIYRLSTIFIVDLKGYFWVRE